MKVQGTKPLIFAFQRQALLKVNFIPGFAKATFWKYCLICVTPLLVLYLAFYLIAFSSKSLGMIIFSTGLMLHPIISLPLICFIKSMITGIEKLASKCKIDARHKFKFTLSLYFAMIICFQIFLTQSWELKFQDVIAGNGADR